MALVGSYVALLKPLAAQLPVFALAFMRFAIAAALLLPWTRRLSAGAGGGPASRADSLQLMLQSLFGNVLFSACMLWGISMTPATAAGVILGMLPVTVAVLSWVVLGEAFTGRLLLSLACAGAGIALLETGGGSAGASGTGALGAALVMGGVVCEAIYVVIGRKLVSRLAPLHICASINLWGLVFTAIPGGWQLSQLIRAGLPAPSLSMGLVLFYYAVAASILAPWLWMSGLRSVPAGQAGAFTVALPLTATVIAVSVLGEPANWRLGVALLLAVAAIGLASWPRPR